MSEHKVCRRQLERVQSENMALKAELERLRADLRTSEASRAGNIERADFLAEKLGKAEAKLVKVVKALKALVIVNGSEIGYRTMHNIPMQMAKSIERKVRAALAAVKDKP